MKRLKASLAAVFVLMACASFSQASIEGASCALPGLPYQYFIRSNGDIQAPVQICITGGQLISGDTCVSQNAIPGFLLLIWNDSGSHQISITSAAGDAFLNVTTTHDLDGGKIEDSDRVKHYNEQQSSYVFHCRAATGGACDPQYDYVWQRSEDGITWADIDGAHQKDLEFSGNVTGSIFFRRIVSEAVSGIVALSDLAQLQVLFE